jgi:hypothetical protein
MNSGLVTSFILILGFFYISGFGFALSLLPTKWWCGFWSVVTFPILGIITHLVFAAILIPRGMTIEFTVALVIGFSTFITLGFIVKKFLNQSNRDIVKSFGKIQKGHLLTVGSLIFAGLLPILFIESSAVLNVRLGIDAALYADGAQSILAHENQPNLTNIAVLHPGSLSTALFFQHFRWGAAFLMAISSLITDSPHSLAIGSPLFSVVLFLIAALSIRILSFRASVKPSVMVLAIALTAGNTFFVRLLTEGQWPNLVAILLIIFLIYITADLYLDFKKTVERIQLIVLSIVICCAILITYAEILPLLVAMIVFTHLSAAIAFRKERFFSSLIQNISPVFLGTFIYFALSNPLQIAYFKFLVMPSYANVGYPTPRTIFPSDMLGLTDLWDSPDKWLSFGESVMRLSGPDLAGLSILNIILVSIVVSATWSSLKLKFHNGLSLLSHPKQSVQIAENRLEIFSVLSMIGLGSLFIYSWLSSQLIQKSDYILIKAASILLIPIIIETLAVISQRNSKIKPGSPVFTISIFFVATLILFTNVQNLSQLKNNSTVLSAGNLVKMWDPEGKTECVYLFNKRGAKNESRRWADRTVDYYMDSVFRNDVILDPWTNGSLARTVDPEVLKSRQICIALRSPIPSTLNTDGYTLIFEDPYWKVFNTNLTYAQATDKFGALENLQSRVQP